MPSFLIFNPAIAFCHHELGNGRRHVQKFAVNIFDHWKGEHNSLNL